MTEKPHYVQRTTMCVFPSGGEETSFKNLKRVPDLNIKDAKRHVFRAATFVYMAMSLLPPLCYSALL